MSNKMNSSSKDTLVTVKATNEIKELAPKNLRLLEDEMEMLRNGIVQRLSVETGLSTTALIRGLNSNLKNYNTLYKKINEASNNGSDTPGSLKKIGITSNKPLAVLFHSSKFNLERYQAFRKAFIEVLYRYAFDQERDDYLRASPNTISSLSVKVLSNIRGCWECYYDPAGNFAKKYGENKNEKLQRIAFQINGDSMEDATFLFSQPNQSGKGRASYRGTNLILCTDSDDLVLHLNCGGLIEEFSRPISLAVGCYSHIDNALSPKVGRCVFYSKQEVDWEAFRIGFLSDNDEDEKSKENAERAAKYFSSFANNIITANVNGFKVIQEIIR